MRCDSCGDEIEPEGEQRVLFGYGERAVDTGLFACCDSCRDFLEDQEIERRLHAALMTALDPNYHGE